MADKTDISGPTSSEGVHNLQTSGDAPVSLPEGFGLAEAAFERSGEDIVLTDADGNSVKVEGYFAAAGFSRISTTEFVPAILTRTAGFKTP